MPKSLYLIDGHALAYRTFFALNNGPSAGRWQTSLGEPTAGVYGFATVLMKFLETEKPDYIAVAFDTGKTFRDAMFPEYKATREKMPDDLKVQINRIRQMVDAFNIPRLEMDGFEADDVLGSIAKQAAAQGLGVKIITGDRDLLQLVGGLIIVSLPEGGKLADSRDYINDADVIAKFGVPARLVVDYKALVGDTSDNIPGVKGIGEKTAQTLYSTYSSLDEIYEHIEEIPGKIKTKLEENKEMAYLSRDLAQIRTDLDINLDLTHAKADQWDLTVVEDFFKEMEFRSLLPKLQSLKGIVAVKTPVVAPVKNQMSMFDIQPTRVVTPLEVRPASALNVKIVDSDQTLAELAQALSSAKVISFDTETTSTNEMQAKLVGISLATEAGTGWYIPVAHANDTNLPLPNILDVIAGPMRDPAIRKIGHNLKYDYLILARNGLRVTPLSFDTMIAEWVIDPTSRNLGLKNLANVRLGDEMTHIDELIGKGKTQITMDLVSVADAAPYAAADAETCIRLMAQMEREISRDHLDKVFYEIEMPLISVLAEMELKGVLLDLPFFEQFSKELNLSLATLESQIYQLVGKNFNINSTQQLSDVLFKNLGLTPPDRGKKTASGHFSTSADVLENMRGQHTVVDLVLEQRELAKLRSTYVDALPGAVDPDSGRVHTSFGQTGSVTGRLSSNNPNLQNIPVKSELGRKVRNGFIADHGKVLLSVDYSQVELRLVAVMAQDQAMLAAFRAGQDIHSATAAAIEKKPLSEVTKDMRRNAKAVNFGLIYGMSAFGLTRTTDLTLAQSEDFVKKYFEQFPGVKGYLETTKKLAAEQGYVSTLLGRRRYFPALTGMMNYQMRGREEREAINAPIQGTAADIMKLAMIQLPPALEAAGLKTQMLLQVHDELLLECPVGELPEAVRVVQSVMENAYPLEIPLETEARSGLSWGTLEVL
jgi:DNA polymerase-1